MHILYAVYGSNLFSERFLYYINGGEYNGKQYVGCVDKSPPIDFGNMRIPHRLYFANICKIWDDKGVAFLDSRLEADERNYALARLWRITEEQFEAIHTQEGSWYPINMSLGTKDGFSIKTFTGEHFNHKNKPSEKYLNVIRKGLIETTGWSLEKCNEYLGQFINQ